MAISAERWAVAKAMFEGGASLTQINNATKIDRSTVSKAAKKQGWSKGVNQQLNVDAVRVIEEKSTLNQQQLNFHNEVVSKEVEKLEKARKTDDFLDGVVGVAAKKSLEILQAGDVTMQEIAQFSAAQNNLRVGLGTQAKFAPKTETTINNTNAQQNTIDVDSMTEQEIDKRILELDGKT